MSNAMVLDKDRTWASGMTDVHLFAQKFMEKHPGFDIVPDIFKWPYMLKKNGRYTNNIDSKLRESELAKTKNDQQTFLSDIRPDDLEKLKLELRDSMREEIREEARQALDEKSQREYLKENISTAVSKRKLRTDQTKEYICKIPGCKRNGKPIKSKIGFTQHQKKCVK